MTADSDNRISQVYRFTRLTRVFWTLELALLALFAVQLSLNDYLMASVLVVLALILVSVYIMLSQNRSKLAATSMFSILSLTVGGLMWYFQGLRDEAMLAFPALIMFSAVIGNRRLFFLVVAYCLITVSTIGLANEFGWHVNRIAVGGVESAAFITVILLITSYSVWLFSSDLHDTMTRLNHEIDRVKESESRIRELAQLDELTHLPNRVAARERFEHAFDISKRSGTKVCLMFLDLDDFKTINDSYGHQTGDEFLRQTALRLRQTLRSTDSVCRLGGDEFLVILESIENSQQISSVAAKILENLKQPVHLNSASIVVTASIGIAVAPDDGEDFDTISRQADLAMYHTKGAGRNNYHFFDEAMNRRVQERLTILSHLRDAIDQKQFELHFQPKVNLASGSVIGAEALIRWNHPTLGLMRPADFIPVAEESGLIVDIGAWVIRESCHAAKRWQQVGLDDFAIAVNISSIQFSRGDFVEMVQDALQASELPPRHLELELTETLLIDNTDIIKDSLQRLREMGVELSIDDFGTGYSNLGYLKSFDVGVLKIDRSFVSKILTSDHDRIIVEAILRVASQLDLEVVAEGVESKAVADELLTLGCEMAQGYYWSEPLNAGAFEAFLRNRPQDRIATVRA